MDSKTAIRPRPKEKTGKQQKNKQVEETLKWNPYPMQETGMAKQIFLAQEKEGGGQVTQVFLGSHGSAGSKAAAVQGARDSLLPQLPSPQLQVSPTPPQPCPPRSLASERTSSESGSWTRDLVTLS